MIPGDLVVKSPHSDSVAFRQFNYIHKVVHWDKSTLKKGHNFCVKYTFEVYTVEVYFKFTYSILLDSILEVYLKNTWSIQYTSIKYTGSILEVYLKVYLKYTDLTSENVLQMYFFCWNNIDLKHTSFL